ncbi:MAG: hypothetical protein Q7J12_07845, partial [Syntrophales bacterium]|nr:hypothetical protein [Syntrophales bacterium]
MKRYKYSVSMMVFLALALVVMGCAKPPEAEKSAAKTALDAAMSAGADKYAATEFAVAKQLWDTAESTMTDKKYKEAKQGYMDAKPAFEKATGAAEAGKKALTDEANVAVAGLEEGWKSLEGAAQTVAKSMKDKKDAWDADVKAFAEGLKTTKDMIAADPSGAKTEVGELQ